MPRTAKQILKARGYTDEELTGLALLNDSRFTQALEAEDAERERLVAENTKAKADLEATTTWYTNEAVPALNQNMQEVVKSRAEIARLNAQLKAEQDLGMRRVANQDNGGVNTGNNGGTGAGAGSGGGSGSGAGSGSPDYTPYDERYVGREVFTQAFAQTGEAIAMAADISEDHRDLFGRRLPEGIGGLRAKYQRATQTGFKGDLRSFWEQEFKVSERRAELAAKEREDHDNKIREETRRQVMSEFANPMTRTPMASNSPFVKKKIEGGTVDGKQPWERGPVEHRRAERVVKFGTKVLTGTGA